MEFTEDTEGRASLAAKLSQVYDDVQYVQKTGENKHHGYSYAEEAEIVRQIRASLHKQGVMLMHSQPESTRDSGLTTTYHEYLFICTDTGGWARCRWQGSGYDKQDKGLYKAHTGATKYFLMKTFLLPTGDDPERVYEEKHMSEEKRQEQQQAKLEKQRKRFFALVSEVDTSDDAAFRDYAKRAAKALTNVDSFNDIPLGHLEAACGKLSGADSSGGRLQVVEAWAQDAGMARFGEEG